MYFPPFFAGNRKKNFPQLPIFSPQLFSPHMGGNTVSPPKFSNFQILGGNRILSPPKLGGNSEDLPPERPILRGKRQKSVPPNVGGGEQPKKWAKKTRGNLKIFPPYEGKIFPRDTRSFSQIPDSGGGGMHTMLTNSNTRWNS